MFKLRKAIAVEQFITAKRRSVGLAMLMKQLQVFKVFKNAQTKFLKDKHKRKQRLMSSRIAVMMFIKLLRKQKK